MTTFYICRHGESENNKNGRLSGWIDTPLTEAGIQNAKSEATKLKGVDFDRIISSDLGRAFATAYIITRELNYMPEIELNKNLREVNYGNLANQPLAAYPHLTPQENTNYAPRGGESLAQMQQRVMAYVHSVSSESQNQTVLLVAHDGTINAIKAIFSNQDVGIVDAAGSNAHDFVGKFTVAGGKVLSFAEVQRAN